MEFKVDKGIPKRPRRQGRWTEFLQEFDKLDLEHHLTVACENGDVLRNFKMRVWQTLYHHARGKYQTCIIENTVKVWKRQEADRG